MTFWYGSGSSDKFLFCNHYFSPLNTFMRKGKDPDPIHTCDKRIRMRIRDAHLKTYRIRMRIRNTGFFHFFRVSFAIFSFSFRVPLCGISKEYLESAYYGPAASPHLKKHRGEESETKTTLRGLVWVSAALCSDALYRRHSQMIPKSRPAQPDLLPTASHTGWTPVFGEQVIKDFCRRASSEYRTCG